MENGSPFFSVELGRELIVSDSSSRGATTTTRCNHIVSAQPDEASHRADATRIKQAASRGWWELEIEKRGEVSKMGVTEANHLL